MDWYEPDTRWNLYAKSREDFVNKFVVEGKFHNNVPEDIVKSFETVTYLLAHSYYHWPMFDEAMSKATLIMELVIKFKAKALNISLELPPNKKGVIYKKRLVDVIDEVFEIKYLKFLYVEFDRARNLRNIKMHPEKHSFMGALGMAHANAQLIVNVTNLLFSEKQILENITSINDNLKEQLSIFKNGIFVLEYNDTKILIVNIQYSKYLEEISNKLLMLYIDPIFSNTKEVFIDKKYPEPLIISLNSFNIENGVLNGIDLNNKPVKIYKTDKPENIKRWYQYANEIQSIDQKYIQTFIQINSSPALWQMEKIIYENCWN
ncbi:hypothetical protein [Olleya marilimosa]|uniref:hypothetical protein n=1 Tax=Olleya marilimosa TaxID=272164 RepID=UPI0030EC581A|tara:strand:- start:19499 stop:20455 length:957 start_codon:yes stop_codon:yes gene_type:complete